MAFYPHKSFSQLLDTFRPGLLRGSMSDGRTEGDPRGMDFVMSGPQADMPSATVGIATGPAGQFMMISNVYNVSVSRLVGGTSGWKRVTKRFADTLQNQFTINKKRPCVQPRVCEEANVETRLRSRDGINFGEKCGREDKVMVHELEKTERDVETNQTFILVHYSEDKCSTSLTCRSRLWVDGSLVDI